MKHLVNDLGHWIYAHLESVVGTCGAVTYGYITFSPSITEVVIRIVGGFFVGVAGAFGAWVFKKLVDKKKG